MKKEAERQKETALFEGMTSLRAVLYAMENKVSDRRIVRVTLDRERSGKKAPEYSFVRAMGEKYGFEVSEAASDEIDTLAVGTSHGGVVFECSERTLSVLTADAIVPDGFYVMLEGIEDPYNFGYAIRSIYAAGADGIVLSPRNWLTAAGVVCRSSAGASERVHAFVADGTEAIRVFREAGYKCVAAGIRDSVSAFDAELKKPLFLAVGGEKRGLSAAMLAECDEIVRLDYGREFPGSLSAASAASILAYEVLRQNRK